MLDADFENYCQTLTTRRCNRCFFEGCSHEQRSERATRMSVKLYQASLLLLVLLVPAEDLLQHSFFRKDSCDRGSNE